MLELAGKENFPLEKSTVINQSVAENAALKLLHLSNWQSGA